MRTAFYVSDGTAITAEVFGHALLSLFELKLTHETIPFVETAERAHEIKEKIDAKHRETGEKPLVFFTFVDDDLREVIQQSSGACYDFLNHFTPALSAELAMEPHPRTHRTHSIHEQSYDFRIDAMNYALMNDDGVNMKNLDSADIILVGVSRSGKTPTSLYLALQYGIKAANYPFTEDDMDNLKLPPELKRNSHKLFGLTIAPERLSAIRNERRQNSRYASMRQCRAEISEVEALYRKEKIPYLNSTHLSVEEISAKVLDITGLKRHNY